jgi:hypothetical protein
MRIVATLSLMVVLGLASSAIAEDTPAATKTWKLLKTKLKEMEFKDTRLEDAVNELKEEVRGLFIQLDRKGGISANRKVNVKLKDKTIEEILNAMCDNMGGVGWYVRSKKGDTYDGNIFIIVGKARGKEEPKKE